MSDKNSARHQFPAHSYSTRLHIDQLSNVPIPRAVTDSALLFGQILPQRSHEVCAELAGGLDSDLSVVRRRVGNLEGACQADTRQTSSPTRETHSLRVIGGSVPRFSEGQVSRLPRSRSAGRISTRSLSHRFSNPPSTRMPTGSAFAKWTMGRRLRGRLFAGRKIIKLATRSRWLCRARFYREISKSKPESCVGWRARG